MGQFNRQGIIVNAVFFILRYRISGCKVRLAVVLWALKFSNQRRRVQHCFLYLCSEVVDCCRVFIALNCAFFLLPTPV